MGNKMISIPDDILIKLRKEDNASGLITKLLMEYYKYNTVSIKEITERLQNLKTTKKEVKKEIEMEIKKVESLRSKVIIKEKERDSIIEENKEKDAENKAKFDQNVLEITGKQPKKGLFELFLNEIKYTRKFNLYRFLDKHK